VLRKAERGGPFCPSQRLSTSKPQTTAIRLIGAHFRWESSHRDVTTVSTRD